MASVEKRGENKYRITVSDGYDRNNKKIVHKKTFEVDINLTPRQLEKELNRLALLFEEDVKSGNYTSTTLTFEKFVEKWLVDYAEKRLEKTTIESYKGELNTKILPAIGHLKLTELKPTHLIRFLDNLTEDGVRLDGKVGGYSTRVIKYQHSIISSILQTAVYWQIISENIATKVQPPKGVEKTNNTNFLDEMQIAKFLKFVLDTEPIEQCTLAFITAYAGLRKGEVLGLTWGDIDLKQNTITINKALARAANEKFIKAPKNKSSIRGVTVPASVIELLKKFRNINPETRIFNFSYDMPTRWFKRVIKSYNKTHEDNLPTNVTFHGLRHTSATLLIAQGLDIKSISARLGHNNTSTTLDVYAHAIKSKDQVASNALENLINIKS